MTRLALGLLLLAGGAILPGCEREIAEIETPHGETEINEKPGGGIEIEHD